MSLGIEALSNIVKVELLARIGHRLTVCARDTYEVGTGNFTRAVSDHLLNQSGYSLQTLLEIDG